MIAKILKFLRFEMMGSCSHCMRQALYGAVATWVLYASLSSSTAPETLLAVVVLAVIATSVLWITHVIVYIGRSIIWENRKQSSERHGNVSAARRNTLKTIARSGGIAMLASMPSFLLSTKAMAYCGQCTIDDDCGGTEYNWCCKNTAPVNAGYVCNECKKCV
ncbi:MAG: hypothetical protein AAF478_02435 [Pseudomonadota bacterium]